MLIINFALGEPTLAHLLFKNREVMTMNENKQKVLDLCKIEIEKLGYELVEVQQGKQFGSPYLTFVIDTDKEGGISLDDCEIVSKAIDPLLDETDCFGDSFNLNVSSPGLDRPLKLERDYVKNKGKDVEINFYAPIDGKKKIQGTLLSWNETAQIYTHVDSGALQNAAESNPLGQIKAKPRRGRPPKQKED